MAAAMAWALPYTRSSDSGLTLPEMMRLSALCNVAGQMGILPNRR